ncbi:MAG: hypothetical protein LBF41_10435 [Deltaproteobacteria bacterium]|jgi:hypothetical protein|nr:hypothetical protein [Deltaproteobacteria bacterium]
MIKKDPAAFLEPNSRSCAESELVKSRLVSLNPGPVPFRGGCLKIYEKINEFERVPKTNHEKGKIHHTLKFPKYEVFSSYRADCFDCVFEAKINEDELEEREKPRKRHFLRGTGGGGKPVFGRSPGTASFAGA